MESSDTNILPRRHSEFTTPITEAAIEEPLLLEHESASNEAATTFASVANLCKAILGGALLALPFTAANLGIVCASVLSALVAGATHVSLVALCRASDVTHTASYASMVAVLFSQTAAALLQGAIILDVAAIMVVYVDVMSDMLVGRAPPNITEAPIITVGNVTVASCSGLLCPLLAKLSLHVSRPLVIAALCSLYLLPLSLMRSMNQAAVVATLGTVAVFVLTLLLGVLAALSVRQHTASAVPLWPVGIGHMDAVDSLRQVMALSPVILQSFACQQCIHPIRQALRDYSLPRISNVSITANAICCAIYLAVMATSLVALGPDVDSDILTNLSAAYLERRLRLSPAWAVAMAAVVQLAYFASMTGSFVVMMMPLRSSMSEVLFATVDPGPVAFSSLTVAITALCGLLASLVQDIQVILVVVGATAVSLIAFTFPAMTLLSPRVFGRQRGYCNSIIGYMFWIAGVSLFISVMFCL